MTANTLNPWKVGDYVAKIGMKYRAIYEVVSVNPNGGMIKVVVPVNGHDSLGKEYSFPSSYPLEAVDWLPPDMIRRVKMGRNLEL